MAFFGSKIHSEVECKWADTSKQPIRPDFYIEQPNGYCDVVEFKLPSLKNDSVVGIENRKTFNSAIYSYIAQTRVYEEYFEDPRNRQYLKEEYDINVKYPKRWLVVCRRWMFSADKWKDIERGYRNLIIRTYDDIIDGVISQLYS
ncbi:hypothetical protein [Clostridium sp. YIM B02551]|uniref:hypothetical protein n=1 Tax=Clostridium sp. YIM B02551 TaxID=2910679 RepID=UPI001EECCE42|nr:hypothetical protein [Clostridium sp. YIM B02551]